MNNCISNIRNPNIIYILLSYHLKETGDDWKIISRKKIYDLTINI